MRGARLTRAAALLIAAACGGAARDAAPDTAAAAGGATPADAGPAGAASSSPCGAPASGDTGVRVHDVNRGTHGMIARTRWLASPDGCTLLVVEDPAAVEAEPVMDGALLVRERAGASLVMAIDSAWDVAPDAAWGTLAWGRGWVVQSGESEDIPLARWRAAARALGQPADSLKAWSFAASGMSYARGVAMVYTRTIGDTTRAVARGPGGWRVRWRGDTVLAGSAPRTVQDDAEPTVWTAWAPGARRGEPASVTMLPPDLAWREGPLLDIGPASDSLAMAPASVAIDGGTVTSTAGRITIRRDGARPREVGPGLVLAATRGARFIVALAPRTGGKPYDPKVRLVVYEVGA